MESSTIASFGGVEVVSVDSIRPASYNPRQVFPERLELVALSLSRLGFLLPIYIGADGEILSGHQRHYVATQMLGAKFVPVVRSGEITAKHAKTLNLLFNRATNDTSAVQQSETLASKLLSSDIPMRAKELPPLDVDSDEFMPIRFAKEIDVVSLLDANPVWADPQGIRMSLRVAKMANTEIMPAVATPSLRLINGKARTAAAGKIGQKVIPVTFVPEDRFEVASGLLNLLSMKYEVMGKLEDDLRSNAFRAAPTVRYSMSVNSTYELTNHKSPVEYFNPKDSGHAMAWVEHYGPNTLDFGAGNYLDAQNAEDMGANAAAFEPYFAWDRDKAREAAEKWFFSRVMDKREFNSIFLSNVMNTVPFETDRRKVVLIIAALCSAHTIAYASSRHISGATGVSRQRANKTSMAQAANSIVLGGEPGMLITKVDEKPAIQKFHSMSDLAQLWATAFRKVEATEKSSHVFVRCSKPREIDPAKLVEALEFEFDLPWQDAPRFGMADRAIEVFGHRMGIDLKKYRKE